MGNEAVSEQTTRSQAVSATPGRHGLQGWGGNRPRPYWDTASSLPSTVKPDPRLPVYYCLLRTRRQILLREDPAAQVPRALVKREGAPPKTRGSRRAVHKNTPWKSDYIQREHLVESKNNF